MSSEYVFFLLDSVTELIPFPDDHIRELDWYADLPMIQRFYRHFGCLDIQPPDETEPEIGNPIALVQNGEILSFAIPMYFKKGAVEIGAVATVPNEQGKGFCRCVISEIACRILASGKQATLTTRTENYAMQAAAKAIGMRQLK